MQRGEQRHLGPFLIGRSATDHHLADPWPLDNPAFQRWRAPLGGIVLLDVVHEVDTEPRFGSGVEYAKHARLSGGRHDLDPLKSRIARETRHVLGPARISEVFRSE